MSIDPIAALAWLATFLLHGTLLLGAAWIAARRLGAPRLRELVWRAALVGSLVTASASTAIGGGPLAFDAGSLARPPAALALGAPHEAGAGERVPGVLARPADTPASPLTAALPEGPPVGPAWPALALAAWIAWAAVGLAGLALRRRRLGVALAGRRPVRAATLRAELARLQTLHGPRGRVRLSTSSHLDSPIALGTGEICLPDYTHALAPESVTALLAHELAHLRRRDAAWSTFAAVLARLFPFQPLLRIAERRLRAEAELCCDAEAVRATGAGAALARCLVEVAERTHGACAPAWTAAMAAPRSQLVARVESALAGGAPAPSRAGLAATAAACALTLVGLACAGPAVRRTAAGAEPRPFEYGVGAEAPHDAGVSSSAQEPELAAMVGAEGAEGAEGAAPAPDVVLRIDAAGAISGDAVRVAAGAKDLAPLRAYLAERARAMPRKAHAGRPGGPELPNGVLRLELDPGAPFTLALRVLQLCGDKDVRIWRLELVFAHPEGGVAVIPYALPRDVGASEELLEARRAEVTVHPERVELHLPAELGLRYRFEEGVDPLLALRVRLLAFHRAAPDAAVVIDARPGTTCRWMEAVIDAVLRAGPTDVSFVAGRP
jgi:beta-lactamase regulating signal transducer with metallopeptidase domain